MQLDLFFERLKEERERLEFSQEAFGAIGGVKRLAQSNYEKGERLPDIGYLGAISKVGADVQYIVTGVRSPALSGKEDVLLEGFRKLDEASKERALAMIYSGTPPAPKFNVQGNVENQFENNYGGINIDKRGK